MKTIDKSPAGVTKSIFKEKNSAYTEKRILVRRDSPDRRIDIRFEQDRRKIKSRRKDEAVWS